MCLRPSIPKQKAVAPPPTPQSPEVQDARMREAAKGRTARGRASTILTGPAGASQSAPLGYPTILGGPR